MKSVALASLAAFAVTPTVQAAVQATYEVAQLKPAVGVVRRIVLTRTADRCVVWSVGATDDQLCIFSQKGTLVAERAGQLQKFVPYREGAMHAPEATGRVRFLPLLSGGVLAWEPLYDIPGNGQKILFNLDVLSVKGSHLRQFAQVEKDSSGNVTRVETQHNQVREVEWEFVDFRTADRWRLPAEITRQRFRGSGLNIPTDDLVRWRLVSVRTVPDSAVDDLHLFSNGAKLVDLRPGALGRTAVFERAKGALESQWKDLSRSQPPDLPSPAWPKLVLGTCLGIAIATVAVARNKNLTAIGGS